MSSAEACRPCHDVMVDKAPLAPHAGLGQARVPPAHAPTRSGRPAPTRGIGRTCQSCHMPRTRRTGPGRRRAGGDDLRRGPCRRARWPTTLHRPQQRATCWRGPERRTPRRRCVAERLKGAAAVDAAACRPPSRPARTLDLPVTVHQHRRRPRPADGLRLLERGVAGGEPRTDAAGRAVYHRATSTRPAGCATSSTRASRADPARTTPYLLSLRARLVTRRAQPRRLAAAGRHARCIPPAPCRATGTARPSSARVRCRGPDRPTGVAPARRRRRAGIAVPGGLHPALRRHHPAQRHPGPGGRAPPGIRSRSRPRRVGPVRVSARLLIRSQWPWMLQQQEELPTPRPRPRVYEVAVDRATVAVGAP